MDEICDYTEKGEFIVQRKEGNSYKKIPLIELDRKSACFKKIPQCSTECETYTKKSSYPCRKKYTIFETRMDYLKYLDMREERETIHDYPRSQLSKKVKLANKEFLKEKENTVESVNEKKVKIAIGELANEMETKEDEKIIKNSIEKEINKISKFKTYRLRSSLNE